MAQKRSGTPRGLAVIAALLAMAVVPAKAADAPLTLAQRALKSGKAELALRALNAALSGRALQGADIARAYYIRGLANAKTGNKAAAIADLSHALWLKGLSDAERQDATAAKANLYQQAGLAAPASEPVAEVPAAKTAETAPAAAFNTAVAAEPDAPDSAAWLTQSKAEKTKTAKAIKAKQGASEPVVLAEASNVDGAPEDLPWKGVGSAQPAAAALAPAATTTADTGDNPVNSVLGSLFGNTPKAQAAPASPPAAAAAAATEAAASPEASAAWQEASKTEIVPASRSKMAKPKPAAKGTIYLQIAALRSPRDAEGLAARLAAEHGDVLSGIEPQVTPVVLGNMGTFYAVRVGPVATASAGNSLCAKLRGKGVDCFIASP